MSDVGEERLSQKTEFSKGLDYYTSLFTERKITLHRGKTYLSCKK